METIVFLQMILILLCLLSLFPIITFFNRKNNNEIDVNVYIKNAQNQMKEDLKTLEDGNKEINQIEKKILICKKKLNIKLFNK